NGCFDASQRQIIQIRRFYSIPQTPDSVITPIQLAYYPSYHSKYNPVERLWDVLENHSTGRGKSSIPSIKH
ncbi:MAG: hypothetical protein KZQ63_08390, partial [Candidatus Thiodiazotropha sp. (ex Lucinoma aequizonata)]|nr:hypothetical protein [Candidatus Thiodiazotropha sp. (ex Lucinoma aequizonata)]